MVFENQNPGRRAQNMSALLALIIMLGILLPIPLGAGFADWMNSTNAPTNIDQKYIVGAFNLTGDDALYTGTGYTPLFTWYNGSDSPLNEVNVTMDGDMLTTGDELSIDENNPYDLSATGDAEIDWAASGTPFWLVYFNYTAKEIYADSIVKICIKMTSPDTNDAGPDPYNNVTDGKAMLSYPNGDYDADELQTVTVELSAGGVSLATWSLTKEDNGKIDENVTLDPNVLREAITLGGDTSFLMLKVTGHDIRDIDMDGSAVYTYNVAKLFNRDDGLILTSVISIIAAALGIVLVQPKYNLPIGGGKGGRRRF